MNINPTDLLRGAAAYQNQAVQANKKTDAALKKAGANWQPDAAILSRQGTEMHSIAKQIRELSDFRPELVAELKERVQSGNYQVDANDLATKMIEASAKGRR